MDNSSELGMDNHYGAFFGRYFVLTFRALPGLLGADKAGAERGILVLCDHYGDFDFGCASSEDICSVYISCWGGCSYRGCGWCLCLNGLEQHSSFELKSSRFTDALGASAFQ